MLHKRLLLSYNLERIAVGLQQAFLRSFVFIFQVKIKAFSVLVMVHSRFVGILQIWAQIHLWVFRGTVLGKPEPFCMKLRGWISASTEAKGSFATGVKGVWHFLKKGNFILYRVAKGLQTFCPVRYQVAVADTCKGARV